MKKKMYCCVLKIYCFLKDCVVYCYFFWGRIGILQAGFIFESLEIYFLFGSTIFLLLKSLIALNFDDFIFKSS